VEEEEGDIEPDLQTLVVSADFSDVRNILKRRKDVMKVRSKGVMLAAGVMLIFGIFSVHPSHAATAKEIDVKVDEALKLFHEQVRGGKEFLKDAKGVLIMPGVIKAGLGIGGEYGEGALRIGGKTVAYYSLAGGSIGFQIGAQKRNVILVFMDEEALKKFRASSGWKAGVDGSVAAIDVGAGGSVDTISAKAPIVSFIFGQKGLMANATIEGAKFSKLVR
jgi:lipid-binding SYLF domain-containing protein